MILYAAFIVIALLPIGQTKTLTCESVSNGDWTGTVNGARKTCWMFETTAIDSTGYTFSSTTESAVEAMSFKHNKKIEFLPENVAAVFPNLLAWDAKNCSIKTISKENFKELDKLLVLVLMGNQIATIFRGTFDGLVSLKALELYDNKIKFVNGATFADLKNLKNIWLTGNECINEDFQSKERLSQMPQTLTTKCGFCEATNPIDYTTCEISKQLQSFETFSNTCNAEKKMFNSKVERLSIENSNHVTKIALLKVELEAAKSAKDQAEMHSSSIGQACERMKLNEITTLTTKNNKLETELKATKDEVIKAKDEIIETKDEVIRADSKSDRSLISLREVFDKVEAKLEQSFNTRMEMKLEEISELRDELQRKDEQINSLNSKNAQLEKKIQAGGAW